MFLLCSTYRPEWKDADYWTRLNHAIGMGYQMNQNIILTGDLNSDLFSSRNNKLIDTMNLFNLTNVIEKPTRITEHSSTLLDPIIISDSVHYSYSDVLKVLSDISDHDASIMFIECPNFQTRSFQRELWLYERTNNEKSASKLDTFIGMYYFLIPRMLMKCVILSPIHSSQSQGLWSATKDCSWNLALPVLHK